MNVLAHISEKPWSSYTEADYSIDQWHKACLIHLHTGPPTSKAQCKLPIKTPNGAVNRNGVSAALAALHGARSPLKAPADQKARAERTLQRLKSQMAQTSDIGTEFLEHHGVKGMKWGVRKQPNRVSTGRRNKSHSHDYRTSTALRGRPVSTLTNRQLQSINKRMTLEQNYKRLNPSTIKIGAGIVAGIIGTAATAQRVYDMYNSPSGKAARQAGAAWMAKQKLKKHLAKTAATGQLMFPGM